MRQVLLMVSVVAFSGCFLPNYADLDDVAPAGEGEGEGSCVRLDAGAAWDARGTFAGGVEAFAPTFGDVVAASVRGVALLGDGSAVAPIECDFLGVNALAVSSDGRFAVVSGSAVPDVDRRCVVDLEERVAVVLAGATDQTKRVGASTLLGSTLVTVTHDGATTSICALPVTPSVELLSLADAACVPVAAALDRALLLALDDTTALLISAEQTALELRRVVLVDGAVEVTPLQASGLPTVGNDRFAAAVGVGELIIAERADNIVSLSLADVLAGDADAIAVGAELALDPLPVDIAAVAIGDDATAVATGADGRVFVRPGTCQRGADAVFAPFPVEPFGDIFSIVVDPTNDAQLFVLDRDHVHTTGIDGSAPQRQPGTGYNRLFRGYPTDDENAHVYSSAAGTLRDLTTGTEREFDDAALVVAVGGGFVAFADGSVEGEVDLEGSLPLAVVTGGAGFSSPNEVVVIGLVGPGLGWRVASCADRACAINTIDDPALGDPFGISKADVAGGVRYVVTHETGVAVLGSEFGLVDTVAIDDVNGRISEPLIVGSCALFGATSYAEGASANIVQSVSLEVSPSTLHRSQQAAGGLTAFAVTSAGHVWGTGRSGVMFDVGSVNPDCTVATPVAVGPQRTLNTIRGVAFLPSGPIVGTEFGEIQALPLVP
jgi:hypothetical protein